MKRVAVKAAHRIAATELTSRVLNGEPFCCAHHRQMFEKELAKLLARGKTVMLRRDGKGVRIGLFSK